MSKSIRMPRRVLEGVSRLRRGKARPPARFSPRPRAVSSRRGFISLSVAFVVGCLPGEPSEPNEEAAAPLGALEQTLLPPRVEPLKLVAEEPPPSDPPCCVPVLPPPSDCARKRWFCNAEGSCLCDDGGESGFDDELTAVMRRPRRPVEDDGKGGDDHCSCSGASVSEPQGGCSVANWFCNASGLCRCAQ